MEIAPWVREDYDEHGPFVICERCGQCDRPPTRCRAQLSVSFRLSFGIPHSGTRCPPATERHAPATAELPPAEIPP